MRIVLLAGAAATAAVVNTVPLVHGTSSLRRLQLSSGRIAAGRAANVTAAAATQHGRMSFS